MFDLQKQLDKRLADLKKASRGDNSATVQESKAMVRNAASKVLTPAGKLRRFPQA